MKFSVLNTIVICVFFSLTNSVASAAEVLKYPITLGTSRSAEMDLSFPGPRGDHGARLACSVAHYSYDDPVIFPGEPNKSHLHMFWGNTDADANSTGESILNAGNSTCEGGVNNRSSYWMPALFNEANEVVLPESVGLYYKTFGLDDYNLLQPIPNGLQMLASRITNKAADYHFRLDNVDGKIHFHIRFPECLAVDNNDQPILSFRDMPENNTTPNSHTSYEDGTTANGCPVSHPYRMPQLTMLVNYGVLVESNWRLASDMGADSQGESLHADYIAAWDPETMERIVKCNIEARRGCQFISVESGKNVYRWQLAERFKNPDGVTIYRTVDLLPGTDRTPFGDTLKPMSGQSSATGASN